MSAPNPVQMQKFLGGVDYPCSRDVLVDVAAEVRAAGGVSDEERQSH